MMSASLMLSAFSPATDKANNGPKSLFSFSVLNPDEKPVKDDGKKKVAKRDDTTKTSINPALLVLTSDEHEEHENEEVDSLLAFPSNDLYSSWDTAVIHPYSFAESFKHDSALVRLTEPTDCGFVLPFTGNVTSEFGWRKRRPHYGTDIDLETGDTVMAAFDGMVRIAKLNRSYGNVVIIRHKNGLETVYAHLSKILVEAGQMLEAGQIIGLGGNTGHSFGSHLHFEMRYLGQAIDAEDFIDFATGTLKRNECLITKSDVETKYDLRALHSRQKKDLNLTRVTGSKSKHGKVITVRKGDTLGRIAQRNHTSIKAICKKNGIKQSKVLRPGQKLKI
ncbi:MAG: Peptidase [Bacteroidetes bacterium]|nr:Peptidase [Bacteroidota bacterium]MDF2450652.1 Peptidase [Bacteroidota bacterium]